MLSRAKNLHLEYRISKANFVVSLHALFPIIEVNFFRETQLAWHARKSERKWGGKGQGILRLSRRLEEIIGKIQGSQCALLDLKCNCIMQLAARNSGNHDIWRLMLACFFCDTFIFCSFPYKPSFFCPPCWQLRRFGYLHFYLYVCCLMFRTPSSLALVLFSIREIVLQVILHLSMRERLKRTGC